MGNLENFTTILIELNQLCNLNCKFCFYRDYGREKKQLSLNSLKSIVDRFPNLDNFFITGGECTLNKDIVQIVEYLSKRGRIHIFTNGNLIDKDFSKYYELERKIYKCYLTIHECDYGQVVYKDIYDNLNKDKTIIKINVNKYNVSNITDILNAYIAKGFKLFSFNYIHNIISSNRDYEVQIDGLEDMLRKLDKYERYIDIENLAMQIKLKKGVVDRNIGLCGNKFIYVNCLGKIYNCPSAMNEDVYCSCANCEMPLAECVSLLEIFKGEKL